MSFLGASCRRAQVRVGGEVVPELPTEEIELLEDGQRPPLRTLGTKAIIR